MVSLKVGSVERFFQMFFPNFSLFPYISMFTAHFVAYLSSLLELPRRGRTAHDHQGGQIASSSFSSFLFLTGKGGYPNPRSKLFSNSDNLYLNLLCEYRENFEFEMFSNCAGNINKSMTTKQAVFTYFHLN